MALIPPGPAVSMSFPEINSKVSLMTSRGTNSGTTSLWSSTSTARTISAGCFYLRTSITSYPDLRSVLSGKRTPPAPCKVMNRTAVRIFPLSTREVNIFEITSSDIPLATLDIIALLVQVVSSTSMWYRPSLHSTMHISICWWISRACWTSIVRCRITAWKTMNLFSSSSSNELMTMRPTLPAGTS